MTMIFPKLRALLKSLAPEDYGILKEGIILVLLIGGVSIFVLPFLFTLSAKYQIIDYSNNGEVGDVINGVAGPFIAILGVFITFLAFYIQYKANQIQIKNNSETKRQFEIQFEHQKKEALKNEIENRFLKLLEIHRQNLIETKFIGSQTFTDFTDKYTYQGITSFLVMHNEFKILYKIVAVSYDNLLAKNIVDDSSYRNTVEKVDIAYRLFSFGWQLQGTREMPFVSFDTYRIEENLSKHSKEDIKMLIEDLKIRLGNTRKSFDGYHATLSHYQRHLFQTVNYINNQGLLTELEKYRYITMLRAQLSTNEQAILFYNSLSSLGHAWEKAHDNNVHRRLITKYNMIKNIIEGDCNPSNVHNIYGMVEFEFLGVERKKHNAEMRKALGIYYDREILGEPINV